MHDAAAGLSSSAFPMPTLARVRTHYASLCTAAASHFGSSSLAGRLLLIDGLLNEGDALLIAASIAGAASLVLEADTEAVRHCVRNGIVDFAVTTLTEALRILKNEVRKHQPIAVLLEGNRSQVLTELVERGVQPDMLRWAASPETKTFIDSMLARGAKQVPQPRDTEAASDVRWSAGDGGSAALRQLDALAGQVLPAEDAERQNWIARAPRYLPRALRLERRVRMTEPEFAAFIAAAEERVGNGSFAASIELEGHGQTRRFTR